MLGSTLLLFPFIQPILELALQDAFSATTAHLGLLVVRLFSADYLLTTGAFLLIYFIVLWLALRWLTHQRVTGLLGRWAHGRGDRELNLTHAVAEWVDDLLEPLKEERDKGRTLADRLVALEK